MSLTGDDSSTNWAQNHFLVEVPFYMLSQISWRVEILSTCITWVSDIVMPQGMLFSFFVASERFSTGLTGVPSTIHMGGNDWLVDSKVVLLEVHFKVFFRVCNCIFWEIGLFVI